MTMSNPSGNNDATVAWHKRTIKADDRTPAQVEAEDGWERPWRIPLSPERREMLAKVNPYIEKVHQYPGVIVPQSEAESHRGRWQALFDAPRPLVVELGCGAGHFLETSSTLRPDCNYVGIDLRYKRLVQAAEKTAETCHNVRYARNHALDLERMFDPGEISEVWVQFPDPWPKSRQASKRMVNPSLVRSLERLMNPGARVRLKSDWPRYLAWFRGSFEGSAFTETAFVADLREWHLPWPNVQTAFEARFVTEGKVCFFLEYTRGE